MPDYSPGDILLVNDFEGPTDWLGGLIRDGERARGDGDDVWTHSALIVDNTGVIVEALQQGVVRSHISKYANVPTRVLHLPAEGAEFTVAYAERMVGTGYGVLDFLSLGVSLLFRNRWSLHIDGEPICSELCARATEGRSSAGYPFAPERMMPSDLRAAWDHVPPLKPLGFWRRLGLLISVTAKAALGKL